MATTITAPVAPAPISGEQGVERYAQTEVGHALPDVTGASTTAAGNIKVSVSSPEPGVPDVSVTVVAAANAYTTAGKFSYTPSTPGLYTITVEDETAGETAESTVEVFSVG